MPATVFNFTFSPMHMRIPVAATTSLLWSVILSIMRGSNEVTRFVARVETRIPFFFSNRLLECLVRNSVDHLTFFLCLRWRAHLCTRVQVPISPEEALDAVGNQVRATCLPNYMTEKWLCL